MLEWTRDRIQIGGRVLCRTGVKWLRGYASESFLTYDEPLRFRFIGGFKVEGSHAPNVAPRSSIPAYPLEELTPLPRPPANGRGVTQPSGAPSLS